MSKYYICGGSDQYWIETKAKTLHGAKIAAGRMYQEAFGGKVQVGEKYGSGDTERIERVAVKRGFDKWTSEL